jgi:uncharacterized protein
MNAIDTSSFARNGASREGQLELRAMPRLGASLVNRHGTVSYHCEGFVDALRRPSMRLAVHGSLPLRCDRCGAQTDFELAVERVFFFVDTEAELAAIPVDDSPEEALLGSAHFDLAELIEDEAILQLPISARHPDCAPAATLPVAEAGAARGEDRAQGDASPSGRPNPFAKLAELRGRLKGTPEGPAAAGDGEAPARPGRKRPG